jgi:phage terminase small subunit
MGKRASRPGELNDQQEAFCAEYIKDLNATKAAIRAGYSEKTAQQIGSRLLSHVVVQQRLNELKAKRAKRSEITADKILRELACLATVDLAEAYDEMGQLKPLHEIPKRVRKAMSALEVNEMFDGKGDERTVIGLNKRVKFWDKPRALELLGKHLKMFSDRVEHDVSQRLEDLIMGSQDKDDE